MVFVDALTVIVIIFCGSFLIIEQTNSVKYRKTEDS